MRQSAIVSNIHKYITCVMIMIGVAHDSFSPVRSSRTLRRNRSLRTVLLALLCQGSLCEDACVRDRVRVLRSESGVFGLHLLLVRVVRVPVFHIPYENTEDLGVLSLYSLPLACLPRYHLDARLRRLMLGVCK